MKCQVWCDGCGDVMDETERVLCQGCFDEKDAEISELKEKIIDLEKQIGILIDEACSLRKEAT